MSNSNRCSGSNNNYSRRSSKYNKNYKMSNRTHNNYKSNVNNRCDSNKKNIDSMDDQITSQQVFDFNQIKFSDDIDTSFVDNKRKKKQKIVDELKESYERGKILEEKREAKKYHQSPIGRLAIIIVVFFLLFALLMVCFYFVSRPVSTNVVTKEKEVIVVDDNYLFLGDSITEQYDLDRYFPDMNVVNSGISGNQTKDILSDLKNRAYQYNPSKVFLLIGTNDIQAGVKEEDTIENIEEILSELKENRPYAELYLEAIYPVDENQKGAQIRTNEEIKSINESLKEYCKNNGVTFIDTYNLLLDSESEEDVIHLDYTKDGLHITDQGYEVITREIMRYIK